MRILGCTSLSDLNLKAQQEIGETERRKRVIESLEMKIAFTFLTNLIIANTLRVRASSTSAIVTFELPSSALGSLYPCLHSLTNMFFAATSSCANCQKKKI